MTRIDNTIVSTAGSTVVVQFSTECKLLGWGVLFDSKWYAVPFDTTGNSTVDTGAGDPDDALALILQDPLEGYELRARDMDRVKEVLLRKRGH